MDDEFIKEDAAAFVEPEEEKTSEDIKIEEPEGKDDENKSRRSEIAQKKHWREKAQKSSQRVQDLEAELATLKEAVKKPTDDQEAKAQAYIRQQARETFEELQKEKEKAKSKELAEFEDKVSEILEENPDISEEELLDAIEEYEVEPKVALKILQRGEKTQKKPRMPQAKRGSPEKEDKKPDDSGKNMWQIAKEEIDKVKERIAG